MIDVVTVNGGLGGLETYKVEKLVNNGLVLTKSDLFVESNSLAGLLGLELLGVEENSKLFLISLLGLNVGHSCCKIAVANK